MVNDVIASLIWRNIIAVFVMKTILWCWIDEFKDLTSGFSGADIANMVNEAAILSVRSNNTLITRDNLMDAFEKVTIGLPKLNKDIVSRPTDSE